MLREYEAEAEAEGEGPARPPFPGEPLPATAERFSRCLSRFSRAPWTLQRLCEVLLAPRNQYRRLHKVRRGSCPTQIDPTGNANARLALHPQLALAIEKCLMVTTEVEVTPDAPECPLLAELRPVNVNPPRVLLRVRSFVWLSHSMSVVAGGLQAVNEGSSREDIRSSRCKIGGAPPRST